MIMLIMILTVKDFNFNNYNIIIDTNGSNDYHYNNHNYNCYTCYFQYCLTGNFNLFKYFFAIINFA